MLSLFENPKIAEGIEHLAGRSHGAALLCPAKNKTKKGLTQRLPPVYFCRLSWA
jgi:hypothetical protein